MKIHEVTIEVEVPEYCTADDVVQRLEVGFGELCEDIQHTVKVTSDKVLARRGTKIGGTK